MRDGDPERLNVEICQNTLEMSDFVTGRIQERFDSDNVRSLAAAHFAEALFIGTMAQLVDDAGPDLARQRLQMLLEKAADYLTRDGRRVSIALDWREAT